MEKDIITIGYINKHDPFTDRRAWSGTVYKTREAIEGAGYRVVWLPYREPRLITLLSRALRKATLKLLGRQVMIGPQLRPTARAIASTVDMAAVEQCDWLFFLGDAQVATFMNTSKPVIYYTDSTAFDMIDYYWKDVAAWSARMCCKLETAACRRANINLRASHWALKSAIERGGADAATAHVLEFGANIDTPDISPAEPYKEGGPLRILFSGVEWERKGGDTAVEATRLLRDRGIDARLTIVGIRALPDYCRGLDYVENLGFLNKNDPSQYSRYLEAVRSCHILLLPTRAECAGIVFSEASAFGLPSYTYATGGTTDYVRDGINGRALPLTEGAAAFAHSIEHDVTSHLLPSLREGALKLSADRLSWTAWSRHFREIMDDYQSSHNDPPSRPQQKR